MGAWTNVQREVVGRRGLEPRTNGYEKSEAVELFIYSIACIDCHRLGAGKPNETESVASTNLAQGAAHFRHASKLMINCMSYNLPI